MPLEPSKAAGHESKYDRLSPDEVNAEVLALTTPANWVRLERISATLCGGIPWLSPKDLLHEALARLCSGTKKWPRGVHPVVVMRKVMHSIASDARKHGERGPFDHGVAVGDGTGGGQSVDERPQVHGVVTVTPQDEVESKEQIAAIDAAVADDEELRLLVMAWGDGLKGTAAADELGWEMNKYEAARKRLLRRLDDLAPERRVK